MAPEDLAANTDKHHAAKNLCPLTQQRADKAANHHAER